MCQEFVSMNNIIELMDVYMGNIYPIYVIRSIVPGNSPNNLISIDSNVAQPPVGGFQLSSLPM
jgi:hypothetical protein